MKKQVFEIDENGYIGEIHVVEFDEQCNPTQELSSNIIIVSPPDGLYRARWDGESWLEDMTQEEIDALNKPAPEQEISVLKVELSQTDYKIIKCYEYQLAGLELPYDIAELHQERQAIRDKINELELTIKQEVEL